MSSEHGTRCSLCGLWGPSADLSLGTCPRCVRYTCFTCWKIFKKGIQDAYPHRLIPMLVVSDSCPVCYELETSL